MVRPFVDDPPAPSDVFRPDRKLCSSVNSTFDTSSFLALLFFFGAAGVVTATDALLGVSGVAADGTVVVVVGAVADGGVDVVDVRADVLELSDDGRLKNGENIKNLRTGTYPPHLLY